MSNKEKNTVEIKSESITISTSGIKNDFVNPVPKDKSLVTYGIWLLFLGYFGAGHFYRGKVGQGIAQLLLALFGWVLLGLGFFVAMAWYIATLVFWFKALYSMEEKVKKNKNKI